MIIFLIHFISSDHNFLDSSFKQIYLENDDSDCIIDQNITQNQHFISPVCLIHCSFNSIITQVDGGAISIQLTKNLGNNIYIENCTFEKCESNIGGAIYLKYEKECHTEIRNSNFISNSATSKDGGTIYIVSLVQCDINLINCLIWCKEYRKIICNAVLIQNTKNFSFYGCIFRAHYLKYNYNVERHGAALCSLNSTGTFENCEFISNTGESLISNEYGGAVFVSKSTFSMKNTTFETNDLQATNCELSGGAIYISNSTYFFEKCCFNYN